MMMSIGADRLYRRRFFGRDPRFASGSLVLDLHRLARRRAGRKTGEPRRTRLFPGL
jgi:hypothetical protein